MTTSLRSIVAALGLCVVVFGTAQAEAQEFTVDNDAAFVQVTGPWASASLAPGYIGSDYLVRPASRGDATVFWPLPPTTTPGRYEVFARWTSDTDRATNALYFVSSDSGTLPITQNQQVNGGAWQSLGTYDFQPGKNEGVTLSDKANGVVVADAVRWVAAPSPAGSVSNTAASVVVPSGSTPSPVPDAAPTPLAASPTPIPDAAAPWTVTVQPTELHAGPDAAADVLSRIPQFSYLQVLGYAGEFAYVYNPRARGTAYASSALLGPSDPPPAWVTAPPPAPVASLEQMGRAVGSAQVAFYPVDDKFAYVAHLDHNQPILVHDRLQAADGSTWYRVDQGYLAAGSVRLPRTPSRTFAGRWLDADLSEPAMLTAYDGNRVVLSTLAIKGTIANQTPTGTFTIQRRVADEIMDSGTLGVPANGPGGYHLEHVLFTQYFTSDGASIHYNYWSSNFGYTGSHGCLGLDRTDSEFLWNWASIGTPVSIHT